jgi:hypothetical protein
MRDMYSSILKKEQASGIAWDTADPDGPGEGAGRLLVRISKEKSGKCIRYDLLSFVDDTFKMGFIFETLGVDLV